MADTLNVIIFYGGQAANEPSDTLLDWLKNPQTSIALGRKIEQRIDVNAPSAVS